MKNKLLAVSCAVSVLASVAALASSLAVRARAADRVPSGGPTFAVVAQDAETRIYAFEDQGHRCYLASTRGGSGISLQCPK